ncbi:uncharacterized protein LOC106662779 [Cimex lectularius]|uniref:Uncharacterized protein n=1 Tax=Cimex lectularius TaxID=79782 RepID=A0A8I6RG03_CIMLE|nr:uncharacterized protein LOC106662779 [Cimex lectularius]
MGKKKVKEAVVPQQDKKICGSICLCQFTVVISCVAVIYLAVAVYMPSYRAFTYGMEPEPVMCQAVNTTMLTNYCDWASCGEWCLTKTSGFCPQIHVTTRRNGTTIRLDGCARLASSSCPKAKPEKVKRYNCNLDNECATLTGVFNCSLGHCANMSELFLCHNHADGIVVDSDKDNLKLNGFFECYHSRCTKYRKNLNCDRYCSKITTTSMNVYLQSGDNVFTGECDRVVAFNEVNGNEPGVVLEDPKEIWTSRDNRTLFASCDMIVKNESSLIATDCINGTEVGDNTIPRPFMNFTTFWKIVENSTTEVDPTHKFLPPQHVLTIYNYSRLYINIEGCVNTLMGECAEFVDTHGNDGDNKTAQSRFPCFYRKNDPFMVVARFDLKKTWLELMVAIFVPSTLFVVSFITLIVIGHSVYVGDDAKMRCMICRRKKKKKTTEEINAEMDLVMDGIIERTNAMADSPEGVAVTST